MEKFTVTLKVEGQNLQTLTEKDGLSETKELVLAWFYMLERAAQPCVHVGNPCKYCHSVTENPASPIRLSQSN